MGEETELEQSVLLNDSILVELEEKKDKTKSGIILPNNKNTTGRVVKTGTGAYTQQGEKLPMQVEEGDLVQLKNDPGAYQDITLDGTRYKFANEREVTIVLQR